MGADSWNFLREQTEEKQMENTLVALKYNHKMQVNQIEKELKQTGVVRGRLMSHFYHVMSTQ